MGEIMVDRRSNRHATAPMGLLLAAVLVAMPVALAGCAVRAAPLPAATASGESQAATGPATVSAADWQAQALALAVALRDVEHAMPSMPEPPPGTKAAGTFEARIVSVSPTGALVVDRQQYFEGEAAAQAAKLAGTSLEHDQFASNKLRERLTLPVAKGAPFVVWYPGDDAVNVSPPDFADMSALSFDEFSKLFASDSGKRETLQYWGGWVTVGEGGVTSFVEPITP